MTNERKSLEESIIKLVSENRHEHWQRKLLIGKAIECVGYSKAELSDRSCDSLSSRLKSLAGVVINELIEAAILTLDEDARVFKSVEPITDKEIKAFFAKKLLTPEELKDNKTDGKKNVLFSVLGNLISAKKKDGTLERVGAAVLVILEQELLLNDAIQKKVLAQQKKYPATPLGQKIKEADELFDKYKAKKLKFATYETNLKKIIIDSINLAGGEFFERLSMQLLKSCYGNSVERDELTAGPEDNGIDGKLYVRDELGMSETIFFQSKTKLNSRAYVSIKVIRELIGVVTAYGATKGVLITNSNFTVESKKFAAKVKNIKLIDGNELFELMKTHRVGLTYSDDILKMEAKTFCGEYEG